MAPRKSAEIHKQVTILLADDNTNGLKARKTLLEELGYRISTASNGEDALDQFGQQKFDLVVTDYKMPGMDGLELISRLRKKAPEVPIILISGFVETLGLNEDNTGADAVIQKAANECSHLTRAVARLLRPQAPRKPARRQPAASPIKAKQKAV